MGMYDYLHSISRNIEQNQVDIKKSQEHQKQIEYVQNELESALFATLQEYIIEYNYNIFDEEIKAIAIDEIMQENNVILYNENYTRQFLNKKYYTVARQVEQVEKKKNANKDDYKKQIALEKWDLQKQIMQQKISEKSQKEAERQQIIAAQKKQARQELIGSLLSIAGKVFVFTCKATLYILLAPLFIIACFGGGFLGGMIKLK